MNTKTVAIIAVVLVALAGGYYYFMVREPEVASNATTQNATTNTQTNTNTVTQDPRTGSNAVEPETMVMLEENKTGSFAAIARAKFTRPGYVVIYRVNSNSDSEIIGHSNLLAVGTHDNFNVQLSSVAAREQTLVAVLHADDGDGEFEFPGSDSYLGNSSVRVTLDTDVVDTLSKDEPALLRDQVELFLKNTLDLSIQTKL